MDDFLDEADKLDPSLFTDWQIYSKQLIGFAYPNAMPIQQSKSLTNYASKLVEAASNKKDGENGLLTDFSVKMPILNEHGSPCGFVNFRGHREISVNGEVLVFRRMPEKIPSLKKLIPNHIYKLFSCNELAEGGLVIVCGATGSGKSTTLGSAVVERLKSYGGVCWTIEDPVEMPLAGLHGEGVCHQTELHKGRPLHEALRGAMRCFPTSTPSILMVGEVRDSQSCQELINASNNGLLVIMTIHANDVNSGIERLINMASGDNDSSTWASTLSTSLRLVVHQSIESGKMKANFLCNPAMPNPVANAIRDQKYQMLNNAAEQQKRLLDQNKNPLAVKKTNRFAH